MEYRANGDLTSYGEILTPSERHELERKAADEKRLRLSVELALEGPSGLFTQSAATLSGFDTGAPPVS
jgi:hypothetical protein